ncbi:MAG: archaetidylserine decarboxylase [Legionellales bacterium]|nr:archaetidylserine decarboxylase [Legionellales bacterium]
MFSENLKTYLQYLLPKQALTHLAGYLAQIQTPALKNSFIRYFIRTYGVNMSEACEEHPENYPDFNSFFIRQLKPECRPIASSGIVSPVDGCVSEIGNIQTGLLLQAKGRYYSVLELLSCDKTVSEQFHSGLFATLYLSPKDYHRIHMPIDATLKEMIYIPGTLFSVQPATARRIPKLFVSNERLVVFFETSVGLMAMVLVGATIVGSIGTAWDGDLTRSREHHHVDYAAKKISLKKAEEMGYFKLGSTVILLFADNQRVQWLQNLQEGVPIRLGEGLGIIH